jgi:hypothetical protein
MKTIYQEELQMLKPYDEVQEQNPTKYGYDFIGTCSHGYLVVPRDDKNVKKAIVHYGFKGKHALYLEEDCEAGSFLKKIGLIK